MVGQKRKKTSKEEPSLPWERNSLSSILYKALLHHGLLHTAAALQDDSKDNVTRTERILKGVYGKFITLGGTMEWDDKDNQERCETHKGMKNADQTEMSSEGPSSSDESSSTSSLSDKSVQKGTVESSSGPDDGSSSEGSDSSGSDHEKSKAKEDAGTDSTSEDSSDSEQSSTSAESESDGDKAMAIACEKKAHAQSDDTSSIDESSSSDESNSSSEAGKEHLEAVRKASKNKNMKHQRATGSRGMDSSSGDVKRNANKREKKKTARESSSEEGSDGNHSEEGTVLKKPKHTSAQIKGKDREVSGSSSSEATESSASSDSETTELNTHAKEQVKLGKSKLKTTVSETPKNWNGNKDRKNRRGTNESRGERESKVKRAVKEAPRRTSDPSEDGKLSNVSDGDDDESEREVEHDPDTSISEGDDADSSDSSSASDSDGAGEKAGTTRKTATGGVSSGKSGKPQPDESSRDEESSSEDDDEDSEEETGENDSDELGGLGSKTSKSSRQASDSTDKHKKKLTSNGTNAGLSVRKLSSSDESDSDESDASDSGSDDESSEKESESSGDKNEAAQNDSGSSESEPESSDSESSDEEESYEKSSTRRQSGVVQDLSHKLKDDTPQRAASSSGASKGLAVKHANEKAATPATRVSRPQIDGLDGRSLSGDEKMNGTGRSDRKRRRSDGDGRTPTPFKRVREDKVVYRDSRLRDNTFYSKQDTYGVKAHNDLVVTRGKGFRKEKTKKKRLNHHGGTLNYQVNSYKFSDDSD